MTEATAPRITLKQALSAILLCFSMTVLLFAAQAFLSSEEAYGVDIIVTSPADDNFESGTLRKAIEAVTATDTDIYFDFGTSDTTIYLNSALENAAKSFNIKNRGTGTVTVVAASGNPVFSLIGGDISISGCTLVGNGTESVVTVADDPIATPTNLTLGGVDPSAAVTITDGGDSGVRFDGLGSLSLAGNVLITNNTNVVEGGGILVSKAAQLSITGNSVIQGNSAPKGMDICYSTNGSIFLGTVSEDSVIVIGSVYTGADTTAGTIPFKVGGELLFGSAIGVEPFATVPAVGNVLVGKAATGPLEFGDPATFSFAGLGSGHWAQFVGDNSAGYTNLEKIVVSNAPTATCPDIKLNDIQDFVITFSGLLHNSQAPKSLYLYHTPSGFKGPEIPPESAFGAGDGFAYSPSNGTVTIPASVLADYIDLVKSLLKAEPLGACKMEIETEGSSNLILLTYADLTATKDNPPAPTPPTPTPSTPAQTIPATSDTTGLVLPFVCFFAGLTLCAVAFMLRRRETGSTIKR